MACVYYRKLAFTPGGKTLENKGKKKAVQVEKIFQFLMALSITICCMQKWGEEIMDP